MAKPLVTDALWKRLEPLLPPHKPRRHRFPGRKPIDDRKALTGILFVLKAGINWEDLPQEMGCGCGMAEAPREAPGRVERGGSDRLGSGVDRQQLREGSRRWRTDRPQPGRPPQEGEQAPDHHRWGRDTTRGGDDGRQCPRRQSDDPAGGRDSTGARRAGPPPTPASQPVWRSGLRLGPASPGVAAARHPSADRAAADAARERIREISLVRRADPVVAAQLREAAGPQG
jgi:hypothetical protein